MSSPTSSLAISIPGKSFLAGEYLALKEGPSLVFTSQPRFELLVTEGTGKLHGIHPESPAGLWFRKKSDLLKNYDLHFIDPHAGRGGWGASTAQFLAVYALAELLFQRSGSRRIVPQGTRAHELLLGDELLHEAADLIAQLDISQLLEGYWSVAWNGEGSRPSGADLIAQLHGQITLFEKRTGDVTTFAWPFAEIDFALIGTGQKLATHEHLRTLGSFDDSELRQSMQTLKQSFDSASVSQFVEGIRSYAEALARLGFVAPKTAEILASLKTVDGVEAAKGCGALGADVVLAVFQKNKLSIVREAVQKMGLEIRATSADLSIGLEVRKT